VRQTLARYCSEERYFRVLLNDPDEEVRIILIEKLRWESILTLYNLEHSNSAAESGCDEAEVAQNKPGPNESSAAPPADVLPVYERLLDKNYKVREQAYRIYNEGLQSICNEPIFDKKDVRNGKLAFSSDRKASEGEMHIFERFFVTLCKGCLTRHRDEYAKILKESGFAISYLHAHRDAIGISVFLRTLEIEEYCKIPKEFMSFCLKYLYKGQLNHAQILECIEDENFEVLRWINEPPRYFDVLYQKMAKVTDCDALEVLANYLKNEFIAQKTAIANSNAREMDHISSNAREMNHISDNAREVDHANNSAMEADRISNNARETLSINTINASTIVSNNTSTLVNPDTIIFNEDTLRNDTLPRNDTLLDYDTLPSRNHIIFSSNLVEAWRNAPFLFFANAHVPVDTHTIQCVFSHLAQNRGGKAPGKCNGAFESDYPCLYFLSHQTPDDPRLPQIINQCNLPVDKLVSLLLYFNDPDSLRHHLRNIARAAIKEETKEKILATKSLMSSLIYFLVTGMVHNTTAQFFFNCVKLCTYVADHRITEFLFRRYVGILKQEEYDKVYSMAVLLSECSLEREREFENQSNDVLKLTHRDRALSCICGKIMAFRGGKIVELGIDLEANGFYKMSHKEVEMVKCKKVVYENKVQLE